MTLADTHLVDYAREAYGDAFAERLAETLREDTRFARWVRASFQREIRERRERSSPSSPEKPAPEPP